MQWWLSSYFRMGHNKKKNENKIYPTVIKEVMEKYCGQMMASTSVGLDLNFIKLCNKIITVWIKNWANIHHLYFMADHVISQWIL